MRLEALLFVTLTLLPTSFQSVRETSYSSIREIDFRNFTYPARPSIGGRGAFTLRNGEMLPERDADGHVIGMWLELLEVVYGDITGDGAEEAIVIHDWITGGSATPHVVYVYTLEKGRPKFVWGTTTGDRADGGLKSAYAESGNLVLETYSPEGKRGDGQIFSFPWDPPFELTPEDDPRMINMMFYKASQKYPELAELKPQKPADAQMCPMCKGTGDPFSGRRWKICSIRLPVTAASWVGCRQTIRLHAG